MDDEKSLRINKNKIQSIPISEITKKDALKLAKINCKECTHCCKFGGAYILEKEIKKIAEFLDIDAKKFKKDCIETVDRYNTKTYRIKSKHKKEREKPSIGSTQKTKEETKAITSEKPYSPCIFLEKNGCRIHKVKPLHCRIGTCDPIKGPKTIKWYMENYWLNKNDPVSVKEWKISQKVQ